MGEPWRPTLCRDCGEPVEPIGTDPGLASLSPDMPTTWFITGASRGFGREWTIAGLERGDTVAATARDTSSLDDLVATYGDTILPLRLDVDDRDAVFAAVK